MNPGRAAGAALASPVVGLVAVLAIVVGCAATVRLEDTIALENRTSTPVSVNVNGGWAGTYAAGAVANVPITGHGGPPFDIEIRSPSGAVLTSMTFSAADAQAVAAGSSNQSGGGAVPCGWIQVSYGIRVAPSAGVPPQDPSGPCP